MESWNVKLTTAAWKGDTEALKLSLQNGADIDNQDFGGFTALMFAAWGGHLEICRLLIDRGCKIDITDRGGETALLIAAGGGHLEICRLLIDRGCKIDITDIGGRTALHWAAREGYLQITRCLVEQGGANPLIKTHEGKTPYDLAAAEQKRQYKEVMEYLQTSCKHVWPVLQNIRVQTAEEEGMTSTVIFTLPLAMAASTFVHVHCKWKE